MLKRHFSSAARLQKSYGFIGLGRMGWNMAKNLRQKLPESDQLVIYDTNATATETFGGPNVVKAKSVTEVATAADTVVTMLPEGKHVRAVYSDIIERHGRGSGSANGGKLFIDSSTIDVKTSLSTAQALRDHGIGSFVDAPVSGGVVGAQKGTLTFMIGAPESQVAQLSPVLSLMGARLVACGGPGLGLSAKLANNYLLALTNIATAEAFQLAKNLGLDLKAFSDIVNTSSGRCWSSEVNNPVPGVNPNSPSSRDYEGGFGVSLMNKDLKLAIDAAELAHSKLVLADQAVSVYNTVQREVKDKDMSVIYRWLESPVTEQSEATK